MILIAIVLLLAGLITRDDTLVLTSGLFTIAASIDTFRYKYFKNK